MNKAINRTTRTTAGLAEDVTQSRHQRPTHTPPGHSSRRDADVLTRPDTRPADQAQLPRPQDVAVGAQDLADTDEQHTPARPVVMAGLLDLVTRGEVEKNSTVLDAHLGGQPPLNAYSGIFANPADVILCDTRWLVRQATE